jgi:hypothetical protein
LIRVNVVEFEPQPRPLGFDIDLPSDSAAASQATSGGEQSPITDTILYVAVPRWAAPMQIDRLINLVADQFQVSADLIVLRIHPPQMRAIRESTAGEDIGGRYPMAPIVALTWTGDYVLEHLAGPTRDDLADTCKRLLPGLRDAELRALVRRTGVILPADESFHYEGPNGRHYENFIRVGTAIQAVDSLDGVAFWLLNELARSPIILLDTWTILSLGLNAERYLRSVEASLAHNADAEQATVVAVECQRYYNEPSEQVAQRLASLRREFSAPSSPPPVLLLVSVSSTGSLAANLARTCRDAGFDEIMPVSLFTPKGPVADGLCSVPEIAAYWDPVECPHCQQGSQTVRILPSTYLLDLAATVRNDVKIRLSHAEGAADFLDRYSGTGAISVHRDQIGGADRHHMVYVDVERLLDNHTFVERLKAELTDVGSVDLVIAPEHGPGRRLAELVGRELGVWHIIADPENLPGLPEADKQRVAEAHRILVVDDVVMTGTRLRQYRNWLHRIGVALRDDFELHFLAGVARPDDLSALQGVIDFTHSPERFHYVELVVLPNWGRAECPWCRELEDLIKVHAANIDPMVAARVRDRHAALLNTASGLTSGLFIPWFTKPGQLTDPWLLGPASIFRATSEPELFAAVASSLQELRNAGELNEHLTLPVAKVLDQRFTFDGRFYDTVISACLLRATRRHDLRAVTVDGDLEQMMRNRLGEDARLSLHGELLFALFRRHLPGTARSAEVQKAFEDERAEAGLRQLLGSALA